MTNESNLLLFNKWCEDNDIDLQVESDEFEHEGLFYVIIPDGDYLLDENFKLEFQSEKEFDFYIFRFGKDFYIRESLEEKTLKYFSTPEEFNPIKCHHEYSPLGISDEYALDGTIGGIKDYINKCKWLGAKTIGYSAKNSIAGLFTFQKECERQGIKPVLGVTLDVLIKGHIAEIKFFAKTQDSVNNLIRLTNEKNLSPDGSLTIEHALNFISGLYVVMPIDGACRKIDFGDLLAVNKKIWDKGGIGSYVYIHSTRFSDEKIDDHYSGCLSYFNDVLSIEFEPVLIESPRHVHPQHFMAPLHLRKIMGKTGSFEVEGHLKSYKQTRNSLKGAISDVTMDFAIDNAELISYECEARIDDTKLHLPVFPTEDGDTVGLFKNLIKEAFKKHTKFFSKEKKATYAERVRKEAAVIIKFNLESYFLILWDVMIFCEDNSILVGPGRGSAAGSYISFLLKITKLDPIEHGLLFERFMNEGRMQGSLADIDIDFPQSKRGEVKEYLSNKYGAWNVCQVGTYTTLKHLAATKSIFGCAGLSFDKRQVISQSFPKIKATDTISFDEVWPIAVESKTFYNTMQNNPDHTRTLQAAWGQIYIPSIHPCATIVFTDKKLDLRDVVPLQLVEGNLICSWEGGSLEKAGFLKLDILGLSQLDKLSEIADQIELYEGVELNPLDQDIHDEEVYKLFKKGATEDIFQASSDGVKKLCRRAQTNEFDHLTAIFSLYRPGPMAANSHNEWADKTSGIKRIDETSPIISITRETMGEIIYQEQVMKIVSQVSDFDLVETDDVRRGMGKKKIEVLEPYGIKFIEGGVKNGYDVNYLTKLWDDLIEFSGYSFNKSHAACYAHLAANAMYFKAHYPLYFYSTAIEKADQKEIAGIIYECERFFPNIIISHPDVNQSNVHIVPSKETNSIYWSFTRIKGIGEAKAEKIINEREKNGKFTSLTNFIERLKGSGVGAGVAELLSKAGAFDSVYNISTPVERRKIIATLYTKGLRKNIPVEYTQAKSTKIIFWSLLQRSLLGFGKLNIGSVAATMSPSMARRLITSDRFVKKKVSDRVVIGGVVSSVETKTSKNGKNYGLVRIDDGGPGEMCYLWEQAWLKSREAIQIAKKNGNAVLIEGSVSNFTGTNVLNVSDNDKVLCDN